MARKTLFGVAAVAVVVVGILVMRDLPPSEEGVQGTIQAAKQHRNDQMQNEDVVLQNADIQNLVQTDFFHRLVTDKGFQKLVVQGELATLAERYDVGLAEMSRACANERVQSAMAKGEREVALQEIERVIVLKAEADRTRFEQIAKETLMNSEIQKAVQAERMDQALAQVDKLVLLKAEADRTSFEQIAKETLMNSEIQKAVQAEKMDQALMEVGKVATAKAEASRSQAQDLLRSEAMRTILERNDAAEFAALASADLARAAELTGFAALLRIDQFKTDMERSDTSRYEMDRVNRD